MKSFNFYLKNQFLSKKMTKLMWEPWLSRRCMFPAHRFDRPVWPATTPKDMKAKLLYLIHFFFIWSILLYCPPCLACNNTIRYESKMIVFDPFFCIWSIFFHFLFLLPCAPCAPPESSRSGSVFCRPGRCPPGIFLILFLRFKKSAC